MTAFSANLGFLWSELNLPDAIRAAHQAGFAAVECHWPYDTPAQAVANALTETGLPMLGLNTRRGRPGENGLSALSGRENDARAAIDEAIAYAEIVDAQAIHVMAGIANGDEAHATFLSNLRYAIEKTDRTILIEPLNPNDAPGYFLQTTDQASEIIREVGASSLKLMFDCYHAGRSEGDVTQRFAKLQALVGHIQIAAVPDRGPPDHGELDYMFVLSEFARMGWQRPIGAEYRPVAQTETSLSWMATLGQINSKD
ncbi:MAG: TIM barrel protein [Pseudomonadota bacterium]